MGTLDLTALVRGQNSLSLLNSEHCHSKAFSNMLVLRVSCLLLVLASLTASEVDGSSLDLTGGREGLALGGAEQEVSFREKREAGRGQKKNLRKKWKKRTNGRRNQVRRNGKGRRNIRKPGRKPRRGKNGKKR